MTPSPTEISIALPHLTLSALAWGPEGGRPVLGLHGWLDNGATHSGLAPWLEGARLVSLDLPGHGRSGWRPAGTPYHFFDWIPDVVAAADALGWERFSLLGHSMGAGISTLVAGVLQDRVERCVLIEGLGPMTTEADQAPAQMRRALAQRRRGRGTPTVYPTLEAAAERRRTASSPMTAESARTLVERNLEEVEGGWVFRSDPALRYTSLLRLTEAQVLAFIGEITAPTLLIGAEDGWPHDEAALRRRREALAEVEVMAVPGGHHVHLDDPGSVGERVAGFLD